MCVAISPTVISAQPSTSNRNQSVIILSDDDRAVSKTLAKHLATNLQLLSNQFSISIINEKQLPITDNHSLVVTIGIVPLKKVIASGYKGKILATLIAPLDYENLTRDIPPTQSSAIYHQAPILRQMLLFKELYPKGRRLGILLTPDEQDKIKLLSELAFKLNLILEYEVVAEEESLSKSLLKLINRTDAVIATNNAKIYNRNTIKSILLTLYRHNKFLLGADKNFIKPGSVATTYTSMQQLLDELVDSINFYFVHGNKLPETHFSKRFGVSFNVDVARSLNLDVKAESHYTDIIQATEINFGEAAIYE